MNEIMIYLIQTVISDVFYVSEDGRLPDEGFTVDSISCYTMELAKLNRKVQALQKQREIVAENGLNTSCISGKWLIDAVDAATEAATAIMDDSMDDNSLRAMNDSAVFGPDIGLRAENMTSRYGSFGSTKSGNLSSAQVNNSTNRRKLFQSKVNGEYATSTVSFSSLPSDVAYSSSSDSEKNIRLVTSDHLVRITIVIIIDEAN
jgi:hypothetical protein